MEAKKDPTANPGFEREPLGFFPAIKKGGCICKDKKFTPGKPCDVLAKNCKYCNDKALE
jgi:hypothetical protein